jgi:hypothetical protein
MRPKIQYSKAAKEFKFRKEVPMKSRRNRALIIVAFALAAVFASAVPASAQVAFQGKFTLSHQVRWQKATLPAGNYTFEIQSLATPRIVLRGPNGPQFINGFITDQKAVGHSMLVVENRGNQSCITELRMAPIGRSIRYSVPKAPKDVELAQGPVTREEVTVAAVNVK